MRRSNSNKASKATAISIAVGLVMVGGALALMLAGKTGDGAAGRDNVVMEDGRQIITLTAKGGYQPRRTSAKAGVPTVLRFSTSDTYDCSASVRIPSLKISKNLPSTGLTEFNLGQPQAGKMQGTCGMGMYPFEIDFI